MSTGLRIFAGRLDQILGEYAFTEVSFIQFSAKQYLIDRLQFAQGKGFRQELKGDVRIVQFCNQPSLRQFDDVGVIECELG